MICYNNFSYRTLFSLLLVILFFSECKEKEYALPSPKEVLQNDVIKRTLGPNIVGQKIEFAYAMGILPEKGKLVSASVEASIEGGDGTFLENNSYFTNSGGVDVPVEIGSPSVNDAGKTTVVFNVDTSAATLRYYYVIPEEARGKSVSFVFSAKSSDGESVSFKMGPYTISNMDMVRNLTVTDGNNAFISISDLTVYNGTEAEAQPEKIDVVYLYRNLTTSAFNHSFISPDADDSYKPDLVIPGSMNRSTRLIKTFNLQDQNLAQLQYGIFIDDLDFDKIDFTDSPNYAVNVKAQAGIWVETSDKKYRAYIYINSINNNNKSAVISIKRLAL